VREFAKQKSRRAEEQKSRTEEQKNRRTAEEQNSRRAEPAETAEDFYTGSFVHQLISVHSNANGV